MLKISWGAIGAALLIFAMAGPTIAGDRISVSCPPIEELSADQWLVAQSRQSNVIVSRTPNSVQLAPGVRTRTATVGGKTTMTLADPGGGVRATIDCTCLFSLGLGGYCFPVQIGNTVACQGSPGSGCSCMMSLIIPDGPG